MSDEVIVHRESKTDKKKSDFKVSIRNSGIPDPFLMMMMMARQERPSKPIMPPEGDFMTKSEKPKDFIHSSDKSEDTSTGIGYLNKKMKDSRSKFKRPGSHFNVFGSRLGIVQKMILILKYSGIFCFPKLDFEKENFYDLIASELLNSSKIGSLFSHSQLSYLLCDDASVKFTFNGENNYTINFYNPIAHRTLPGVNSFDSELPFLKINISI